MSDTQSWKNRFKAKQLQDRIFANRRASRCDEAAQQQVFDEYAFSDFVTGADEVEDAFGMSFSEDSDSGSDHINGDVSSTDSSSGASGNDVAMATSDTDVQALQWDAGMMDADIFIEPGEYLVNLAKLSEYAREGYVFPPSNPVDMIRRAKAKRQVSRKQAMTYGSGSSRGGICADEPVKEPSSMRGLPRALPKCRVRGKQARRRSRPRQ